jgi:hypothetical protein
MPAHDNRYSVNVKGRDRVEYKDRDRTVVFEAGMLDQEVYLGREKVTAGPGSGRRSSSGVSPPQRGPPDGTGVHQSGRLTVAASG